MEKWKPVPGYEGIYEASNLGNVRTAKNKKTYTERHGERKWKQRVLKTRGSNPKTGYRVSLWKNGKCKDWLIARVVAMTWVEGYSPELTVNHIDGNRFNNNVSNLEWVTLCENIQHGFETGLYKSIQLPVKLEDGEAEKVFESFSSASRFLGRSPQYVSDTLRGGEMANVTDVSGCKYFATRL